MPPKFKFSREEIVSAAVGLTREQGIQAVTARALAERLSSSAKPIFGLFENMEEVRSEVMLAARKEYFEYLATDMASGEYPPYKASGMAYIRFAKEERELFKLLFMRNRSSETVAGGFDDIEPIISLIESNTGLSKEEATLFHLEMWVTVHGIATMIATSYLEWDQQLIGRVLTDCYEGLKYRFTGNGKSLKAD